MKKRNSLSGKASERKYCLSVVLKNKQELQVAHGEMDVMGIIGGEKYK